MFRSKKRKEIRKAREKKFNTSTIFSSDEKIVMDIIVKSDFSTANIWGGVYNFKFNNLFLMFYTCNYDDNSNYVIQNIPQKEEEEKHTLKSGNMGIAKEKIILEIIEDKKKAFVENTIVSAFNNKKKNAGDCPYCQTKNSKDKSNCINCGAVIKTYAEV